jgi:hypothetical protein
LTALHPESQLLQFPVVVVVALAAVLGLLVAALEMRRPKAVRTRIQRDLHRSDRHAGMTGQRRPS